MKNKKYENRKCKREIKRKLDNEPYNDFYKVFTYDNLVNAALLCKRNVNWKASVQNYTRELYYNVYKTYDELMNDKFKVKSTYEFDIYERGKKRHIRSVHIRERVVQRCLCDNCLVPIIQKILIYDNGASMKNKGIHFSLTRLKRHLQKYYRQHGNTGYVLLFDYSDYFGSINHEYIMNYISKYVTDEKLLKVIWLFVKTYDGDTGLGLGGQISQVFSLLAANPIDHLIKDKHRVKYYIRYMDDGMIIHHDKEFLQVLLKDIIAESSKIGLKLNLNKTKIVKLERGFTFLKKRISMDKNGKICIRIGRKSITRMRRKLKKFKTLCETGKMQFEDVQSSYQSWKAFAKSCNSYNTIKNMDKLYNELFGIK